MMITRDNYEAFMLDYFEGNLPSGKIDELMLFLENNPDLKEDLEDFEELTLVPEAPVFENKLALKKGEQVIHLNNYEHYFIAEVEGENPPEITKLLAIFLKENPSKKTEFETYQKTKLAAPVIVFEDKKVLKKETRVIPLIWWYSSAAAVILMLFMFKNLTFNDTRVYIPIANQIEKINNNLALDIDVEEDIRELKVEREETISKAIVSKSIGKKVIPTKTKKNRSSKKIKQINASREESDNDNAFANNQTNKEEEKDSSITNKPLIDEVLYAESVKITYDDDPQKETPAEKSQPTEKKRSRIGRILTKSLVDKNILKQKKNKDEEVVAYAFNLGKLGFSRNRKKNKN